MPIQNLKVYPDISTAVNELKAKLIDAIWMDLKPAQEYASAGDVKVLVQDMNQQLYAIGMKKGADSLRDKINEALTQLQNDGTLANLQLQYQT
jgi:polar amino acid transport system substrate-binding protein